MSNPFEAAIKTLGYAQEGLGYWKPNPYPDLGTTWVWHNHEAKNKYDCLRVAQHVLEAAGGVDKARLISLINGSELRHALMGGGAADPQMYAIDADAESQLRALLSALPEVKK